MQDKILKCRDCGGEFVFTSGEQDFYAQKGFSEPTRCPSCRAARKNARSDGGGFGGSREREMYPAVCAQCGKPTEVPFQPRSDRPVYCSDCFATQRSAGGGSDRPRRSGGGGGGRSGGFGGGRGRSRRDDDDRW